jgi:glycogen debranching enzyme
MRLSFILLIIAASVVALPPNEGVVPHAPITPGPVSREVILAGGGATHFACESHDENRRAYHGLYNRMHEYIDGWRFRVGDRVLEPADGSLELWPWTFQRAYDGGATESLFMPRRLPGAVISLEGVDGSWAFEPHIDMRHIWDVPKPEYEVEWNERLGALFVSRVDYEPPAEVPRVIAIVPGFWSTWENDIAWLPNDYTRDKARRAMEKTNPWIPGRFHVELYEGDRADFAIGLGADQREAFSVARDLLDRQDELRAKARDHFADLATRVPHTSDDRLNKALTWARYSMDQLIMDSRGPGIYAGYHWFTNYWGRDSFISLPGACLVSGDFDRAKAILASFAEYQLTDPTNPREGRLPNIVNPDNLQYAGVDGTWWWVRALRLYLDYTRDLEFMREMRPVVDRAIAGALRHAVDEHGLLTHGDGETWMDAGGEANPRSPRGNRAVEVEALWIDGLDSAALFARVDGDSAAMRSYQAHADKARASFLSLYTRVDGLGLADHLNVDGSQDLQLRPNQLLAITIPRWSGPPWAFSEELGHSTWSDESWIPGELKKRVVVAARKPLILSHGVTSLDPSDPAWLTKHVDWSRSHFDDAYHNGDIWLWLSGAAIEASLSLHEGKFDPWNQVEMIMGDLLDSGVLGGLREIRDGGEGDMQDYGGATSQAWSYAEFLRVFNEVYLGVHPQLLDDRVIWDPRVANDPSHVTKFHSKLYIGDQVWKAKYDQDNHSSTWKWMFLEGTWPEGISNWEIYYVTGFDFDDPKELSEKSMPMILTHWLPVEGIEVR